LLTPRAEKEVHHFREINMIGMNKRRQVNLIKVKETIKFLGPTKTKGYGLT